MPAEKYELRLSFPRLLFGLLVTIIPISLAGLYSLAQSDRALERNIGLHFQAMAESTAAQVSSFIHDRLANVGFLAVDPAIVDEIVSANKAYAGARVPVPDARIQEIEKAWTTPAAQPIVDRILATRASQVLRRFRQHDPRFLRVTATDAKGAFIAGTHKSLDYFQADEDFWQAVYASGRGAVNITDVRYDEITKSYYIGIGVPVMEENRFLGVIDALVDISSMFPLVGGAALGPTSRAVIVKEDGTVIAGPNVNLAMGLKSEEYAALSDRIGSAFGRRGGYVVADVRGGNRSLIAYSDTGLKRDYGNLAWAVLIAQDGAEAFAPIRTVGRLLAFMSLMGLVAVTLLTVYFVLHRQRQFTEIETLAHKYAGAE